MPGQNLIQRKVKLVNIWDFTGTTPPENEPEDSNLDKMMELGIATVVQHTLEHAKENGVDPKELIPSAISHIVQSIDITMMLTGQSKIPTDKLHYLTGLITAQLEPKLSEYLSSVASDISDNPNSIGNMLPQMMKSYFRLLREAGVEL